MIEHLSFGNEPPLFVDANAAIRPQFFSCVSCLAEVLSSCEKSVGANHSGLVRSFRRRTSCKGLVLLCYDYLVPVESFNTSPPIPFRPNPVHPAIQPNHPEETTQSSVGTKDVGDSDHGFLLLQNNGASIASAVKRYTASGNLKTNFAGFRVASVPFNQKVQSKKTNKPRLNQRSQYRTRRREA